jgi:hypothetical protein
VKVEVIWAYDSDLEDKIQTFLNANSGITIVAMSTAGRASGDTDLMIVATIIYK